MKNMFGKKDPKTNKAFKNLGILYNENLEYKKALSIFKKYQRRYAALYGEEEAEEHNEYIEVKDMIMSLEK